MVDIGTYWDFQSNEDGCVGLETWRLQTPNNGVEDGEVPVVESVVVKSDKYERGNYQDNFRRDRGYGRK